MNFPNPPEGMICACR